MAKPIIRTPALEGAEAQRFLEMHKDMTITTQKEKFLRSCVEVYRKSK